MALSFHHHNLLTGQECKNKGSASGFDTTTNQECENLICTHPGENATRVQEGLAAVQQGNQTTPVKNTREQCFTSLLTQAQITSVIAQLHTEPVDTLAELCQLLEAGAIQEKLFIRILEGASVSETIQAQLIQCLINAGVPFEPIRGG